MKKICIIVDHPSRDLVGITYFAQKIISKNYELILVPMYHWHEILLIRPDIVILNHGRTSRAQSSGIDLILKYCEEISIECFVLDNEGGIVDNNIYKKIITKFPYKHKYFLWGQDKKKLINKKNFIVTGHPRYDLYKDVNYNSKFLSKITKKIGKDFILINTSFPGSNPIKKIHWDATTINDSLNKNIFKSLEIENINFKFFVRCINEIFIKFKKEKFIVRPHPFENINFYKKIFGNLSNVKVLNKSDVYYYIRNCKFVINSNCQTSLEASIMSKALINISTKHFEKQSQIIHSLKKPFYSLETIEEEVKKNIKNNTKINYNYSEIAELINNLKEKSYPKINQIILKSKLKPKNQNLFIILKIIYNKRGFIGCIKFICKLFIKIEDIFKFKSIEGKDVYKKKYFNENSVKDHLDINGKKVIVSSISTKDLYSNLTRNFYSIKIKAQ